MDKMTKKQGVERVSDMKAEIRNIRLNKPQHIKRLINEQINELRQTEMDVETRARAIGYLSNIVLKSMEQGEMAERLEYVFKTMKEQETKNQKRMR